MNPHQKNKIDVNSLSPDEQRLFRLYGKLPSKSDHFAKHLKERKYFDSGDYALSKAGKADSVDAGSVGSQHPVPENIPHLSSPVGPSGSGGSSGLATGLPHLHHASSSGANQAGSPVKESSFLNRETSADDVEDEAAAAREGGGAQAPQKSPALGQDGKPLSPTGLAQQPLQQSTNGQTGAIPIRR